MTMHSSYSAARGRRYHTNCFSRAAGLKVGFLTRPYVVHLQISEPGGDVHGDGRGGGGLPRFGLGGRE